MTTSGTSSWSLDNAGVVVEAFARCGIHTTALTRSHFFQATRSLNLALQSWANRGPSLWMIDLQSIPLVQGVKTYTLPSNTVNILDAYLETYILPTSVAQTPNFSTIANSTTVTVTIIGNNLVQSNWINVVVPVSVGGIVIQGLYQVQTIVDGNNFTITAASAATSTVNNGGVVPIFTAVSGSNIISCSLPSHGLSVGNTFYAQVSTSCGGLVLYGAYIVATTPDSNTFTFAANTYALFNDTESENTGNSLIYTQYQSPDPTDKVLTSISRTDYVAYPDKLTQGPPSTYWLDRVTPQPTVTLWQVPDGNGPYVYFYYRLRRIQDAYTTSGQTADIPYTFLDALCAELAMRLARKYAPALVPSLAMEAKEAWALASEEDRERVQTFICPDTSGYFR